MITAAPARARTTEVAAGVHAHVPSAADDGRRPNNAGLVVGADGRSLLIDTAATERRTRALREEALRLASGPPHLLVNTHFHGDHAFGNHRFPEALVVAHEPTRTERATAGLQLTGLWPEVCWGDVRQTLPHLTFRNTLTLYVGGTRVELLHVGPAAHTTNDIVVWLPEQRVLFAGDVLMNGSAPFCLMGSVTGSLAAAGRLRALDAHTIVPGHGPVGGPELIDANEEYLRRLADLAEQGVAAGLSPLDLARETGTGPYGPPWPYDQATEAELLPNLQRAYAELRGTPPGGPLDLDTLFQELATAEDQPACAA
ncbi:MBL fold metallo-hydrolase [Streptomyces sp. NPDC021093]|uniref:MBL fold metallo-hydrolase n=1 Tax=Streptomyces sp. NPDC021093 TaxID=3365112 RepID=UPI0037A9EE03